MVEVLKDKKSKRQTEIELVTATLDRTVELMLNPELSYFDRVPVVAGRLGERSSSVVYPVFTPAADIKSVETGSVYRALNQYDEDNGNLQELVHNLSARNWDAIVGPSVYVPLKNSILNFMIIASDQYGLIYTCAVDRSDYLRYKRVELDLGGRRNG